jgi:hypothetical protein
MRHSNQIAIFWQVEIRAIPERAIPQGLTTNKDFVLARCIRNEKLCPGRD